jgi:4-hydroxy-tetrahydrodipicolinate synthase
MKQLGLLASDHVRPPLIPLTEAGQQKVRALAKAGEQYLTAVDVPTAPR